MENGLPKTQQASASGTERSVKRPDLLHGDAEVGSIGVSNPKTGVSRSPKKSAASKPPPTAATPTPASSAASPHSSAKPHRAVRQDETSSSSDWPVDPETEEPGSSSDSSASQQGESVGLELRRRSRHPRRVLKDQVTAAIRTPDKSTSVLVSVNGFEVECLVDSGSPTTMVSKSFATSCRLSWSPLIDRRRWVSAGDNPLNVLGKTTTNIAFGATTVKVEVIVVDGLVHEALIGTDVLLPNEFVIDYQAKTLTVGAECIPIKVKGYDAAAQIYTSMALVLPRRSELKVWLRTVVNGVFLVETSADAKTGVREGLHEAGPD